MSAQADRASDEATRRRAQLEFDGHQVVEAGAGTGKTAVLVARILAWCAGPGWERTAARLAEEGGSTADASIAREVLGRVVAITFTEAAAAEMSTRVSEGLLRIRRREAVVGLLDEAVPEAAPERAQALLDASDQIVIQTIHAFCRRLLVAHPLAAHVHPHFEVDADEAGLKQVAREIVEGRLQDAYGPDGNPDAFALGLLQIGPPALEAALVELMRTGAGPPEVGDPVDPARIAAWRTGFLEALAQFEIAEGGRIEAAGRAQERTVRSLAETKRELAGLDTTPEALRGAVSRLRDHWNDRDRTTRLRGEWEKGRLPRTFDGSVAELVRAVEILRPYVDQLLTTDFDVLIRSHRFLGPLLEAAQTELRRRGIEPFAGLLRDAEALLARSPDVAARVRAGIDQMLVDEFQDTDALQCEILRRLSAGQGPAVFVVGDPKQSIYGWRNADLAAYRRFVESLLPEPRDRGVLCVNHRSVQQILDEVERCVAPLLGEGSFWQAPFQPLYAGEARSRDFGVVSGAAAPVEHWISWDWDPDADAPSEHTSGARATRLEAAAVAADIARQVDAKSAKAGDFAILLRGLGDLEAVLAALRQAGVPYVVERDQGYYQRREIIDASALVRWLLDPNDGLALVCLLKSPLVGAPDAALVPLWRRGLPGAAGRIRSPGDEATHQAIDAVRSAELPLGVPGLDRVEGWRENAVGLFSLCGELREAADREGPDRFVEHVRRCLLVEASEAGRALGQFRIANLDRFFRDLAFALEAEDVSAVLSALRTAVSTAREEEEGRPRDVDDRAVHVLSIHKSKGLAFDQVYVMQLHRGHGGRDRFRTGLTRLGERSALTLLGQSSLEVPLLARDHAAMEEAERERVLYVAMTRARRRLVLVGKPDPDRGRGSPALLLRRRIDRPDPRVLAERLVSHGRERFIDEAGARWVFPGRLPDTLPEKRPRSSRADRNARVERARADAVRIGARRSAAASRMARSFVGRASDMHAGAVDLERAFGAEHRGGNTPAIGPPRLSRDRADAMLAGTAVHAALEVYDPTLGALADGAARSALASVVAGAPSDRMEAVRALAEASWRGFVDGPLHDRLTQIAGLVVARELPVLGTPPAGDDAPVGFVSGAIDLVYREPDGHLVVVDYKTDAVDGPALGERARSYAGQGAVYTRVLREALDLEHEPRFELWFLQPGAVLDLKGNPISLG